MSRRNVFGGPNERLDSIFHLKMVIGHLLGVHRNNLSCGSQGTPNKVPDCHFSFEKWVFEFEFEHERENSSAVTYFQFNYE